MKTFNFFFALVAVVLPFLIPLSCNLITDDGDGILSIHFSDMEYARTKAYAEVPDTMDFLLEITDASGRTIYSGKYGDSEEYMTVGAGTYYVSVRSIAFDVPAFEAPVYGDDQCVVVPSGASVNVTLSCTLVNSGLRLNPDSGFSSAYPNGGLCVKSADGSLDYAYSESRTGYFSPGDVSVLLDYGGTEAVLFVRTLSAREILTVGISVGNSSSGGSLNIDVDTSKVWTYDDYIMGSDSTSSGNTSGTALSVAVAKENIGAEGVWVYGYIAGCFKAAASALTSEEPFPSSTNLAIAARRSVTEKSSCLSVELKKGSLRDDLNLSDNPDNLGRKVFLKGDIVESYYGIPGIKNITDYILE